MVACALLCKEPQVGSDASLVELPAADAGAALPASLLEVYSSASCLTNAWLSLATARPE